MTILLDALDDRIPIENAGYLALRELCNRGSVPVELLLLAHSLAQWVSIATIEELDGSFLERARELEPDNLRVLYASLDNVSSTKPKRCRDRQEKGCLAVQGLKFI